MTRIDWNEKQPNTMMYSASAAAAAAAAAAVAAQINAAIAAQQRLLALPKLEPKTYFEEGANILA
jgi:hypothetical protein